MSIMGGRFPVKPVEVLLVLGNVDVELLGGQYKSHSLILLHVTLHHNDLILTLTHSEVNCSKDMKNAGKVNIFS